MLVSFSEIVKHFAVSLELSYSVAALASKVRSNNYFSLCFYGFFIESHPFTTACYKTLEAMVSSEVAKQRFLHTLYLFMKVLEGAGLMQTLA